MSWWDVPAPGAKKPGLMSVRDGSGYRSSRRWRLNSEATKRAVRARQNQSPPPNAAGNQPTQNEQTT